MYSSIYIYFVIIIGYFFLCRFSFTLIKYLYELIDNFLEWANILKDNFNLAYKIDCKKPWEKFKKEIDKLGVKRKDLIRWKTISIILLVFNAYMLAQFMNALSAGLSIPITPFWFPIPVTYGFIVSIIIVTIEIGCGTAYNDFFIKYENNPENGKYHTLKLMSLSVFICLMVVECVFWGSVSTKIEIINELKLSGGNILNDFIDYFLVLLAVGISFFEFISGQYLSELKKYSISKSVSIQKLRFFISSLLYFILYFFPNILLRISYAIGMAIIWSCKLLVLPGNFIYDNISKKIP